jgi:hypothetical protein
MVINEKAKQARDWQKVRADRQKYSNNLSIHLQKDSASKERKIES